MTDSFKERATHIESGMQGVEEEFRDKISSVDESGKRIWIYPKKPKGQFYNYRKYVSYICLAILFGLPWIKSDGEPYVLFNIIESKFIILGVHYTLQDFHLFVIAMLIGILFIVLFTVIYGRLFCGWVCPQTIFMEMFFRRIEYWIEGDAGAQKRLKKSAWTIDKYSKKMAKHTIFIIASVLIAHTFLAYIIGIDQVYTIITEPISAHWQGLIAMIIFTLIFYSVFSTLRDQVCTTICPYGRLQGVLLDDDSLAVAYDFKRGEPRGKISKKANPIEEVKNGDCIDCALCVKVCPTGIDIRNGTQLECINCTACMDACDEVMIKVNRDPGLVRIDSYNGILNGTRNIWSTRVMAYTAVLILLIGLEGFLLFTRSDVEALFLRTPGMLYQRQDDGQISNLYNYQLTNKTAKSYKIDFKIEDLDNAIIEFVGEPPTLGKNGTAEGAVFIKVNPDAIKKRKTKLTISVLADGTKIESAKTTFLGPG